MRRRRSPRSRSLNGVDTKLADVASSVSPGVTVRAGLEIRGRDITVRLAGKVVGSARLTAAQSDSLGSGTLFGVHAQRPQDDGGSRLGKVNYTP
ncbi:hypothetical protein BH23ACT3_BH23ACT3_18120 [soil metagenome]